MAVSGAQNWDLPSLSKLARQAFRECNRIVQPGSWFERSRDCLTSSVLNDPEDCRMCYDAFFAHYPYCYGYRKKYNDVEKKHGNKEQAKEAFPCISTGIFGYPNTRAARVVLETLREWLETDEYAAHVERIILCLFLKVDVDIYKKFMKVYFPVERCTLTDVNENTSTESKQEENSPGQSDKTSDNEEETTPHKDES